MQDNKFFSLSGRVIENLVLLVKWLLHQLHTGLVNQRMRCWKGMLPLFLKPTESTGFTTRTGYRSRTEASAFETSTFGSAITPMLPKRTFIRCDVYRAINRRRSAQYLSRRAFSSLNSNSNESTGFPTGEG